MDQQMVSFRRIPEDDRAARHMQREGVKETGKGTETDTDRRDRGILRPI